MLSFASLFLILFFIFYDHCSILCSYHHYQVTPNNFWLDLPFLFPPNSTACFSSAFFMLLSFPMPSSHLPDQGSPNLLTFPYGSYFFLSLNSRSIYFVLLLWHIIVAFYSNSLCTSPFSFTAVNIPWKKYLCLVHFVSSIHFTSYRLNRCV